MPIQSLDPRVARLGVPGEASAAIDQKSELDQLETWEVFHQERRGGQPVHVGSLHASGPELALVLAKEQFARRGRCVSLWVVRTDHVHAIGVEDADVFATTPEKTYREAGGYRVGTRLTAFKRRIADESQEAPNAQ